MSILIQANSQRVEFGVTQFPDRKNKCLYIVRGAVIEPLAYFRNDECADQFQRALEFIIEAWEAVEAQKTKG